MSTPVATTSVTTDIIDQLVGIQPNSTTADVRSQRPLVIEYAQRSYDTIFAPTGEAGKSGLSLIERGQAALRVAVLEDSPRLIAHYSQRLAQLGESNSAALTETNVADTHALSGRSAAILRHVDLLTLRPAVASPNDLRLLQAEGLNTCQIVTLSQLIAFVSFQVRIVATLRGLENQGVAGSKYPSQIRVSTLEQFATRSEHSSPQGFTLDALGWDAWLDILDFADATPDQIAVLEESTPTAKTSPYYLLLVQDVDVLRARSRLYNAIMYGPRGLQRAERELAALAVSRLNGCPYCASIHAQRFAQLTKKPEIAMRLWQEGVETHLESRARAIVNFAVKLTSAPNTITSADLTPLRHDGLNDLEIADLAHVVAMFAWANRLMQTLGEPVSAQQ